MTNSERIGSDLLSKRMTFAVVIRADYSEIQRLKKNLLNDYDCTVAHHETASEKRYITDTPPKGVDPDDGEGC